MPDAPVDSWKLIFDPAVLAKFKDCGVSMLDDPTDMVGTALLYLGKDPNSESEADLKAAEDVLMKIRPYLRTIHSSQYIDQLANGELCIAVGYSGDVLQARDRAEEAGKPLDIAYSIPKEGALMWFDTLAIPADAAHPGRGAPVHRLPAAARSRGEELRLRQLRQRQQAATPLVNADLRNDTSIYPTPEVAARLQPSLAKSAEFTRALNRTWTRFMTARHLEPAESIPTSLDRTARSTTSSTEIIMATSPRATQQKFEPWTDPDAKPYVRIEKVTKKFGDFVAVDDVSLNIYKKEIFCLLGASGCGKTTLLRMLAGFERPTSGRIFIDGVDMTSIPPYERPVNMMFQSYAMFPHMTVEQNVAFGLKQERLSRRPRSRAASTTC